MTERQRLLGHRKLPKISVLQSSIRATSCNTELTCYLPHKTSHPFHSVPK